MSKQVKSALKAAKQLIQSKDYDTALQKCKELLGLDPNNYNGLVFSGLAYAELNQRQEARAAYHDAIAAQSDQILAYQGLVSLYTKHWVVKLSKDDTEDLILAYKEIIRLLSSSDVKKVAEVNISLSKAYCSIGKFSECLNVLVILSKKYENVNLQGLHEATIQCLKSSVGFFKSLTKFSDLVFDAARHICYQEDVDIVEKEEIVRLLLVFLQSDPNLFQNSLKEIATFLQTIASFEKNSSFIADIFNQIHLQDADFVSIDTSSSYQSTLAQYNGLYKSIVEGYQSYDESRLEHCVEALTHGISTCPDFIPAQLTLCKAFSRMLKWETVETCVRTALQGCKRLLASDFDVSSSWLVRISSISGLKLDLTLCLADALCGSDNPESWKTAIGTYEKLLKIWPESVAVCLGLAKAFIKQKDWKSARTWLQHVRQLEEGNSECQCWDAYVKFMESDARLEVVEELQSVVTDHPDTSIGYFLLGKMLWELGLDFRIDKSKALSMLIKAAKLNPYKGETFLYLGHYYRDVAKDAGKATRCYEKSYNLGPKNEASGTALADQYVAEGNVASAITLYEAVTNDIPAEACRWAWLRLGLCRLRTNQINAAIVCFQSALRSDMDDHICWECLGEGYLHRGSYTAAWKAFNKAHELEPTSVYSIYQMATIKKILRQYTDAIAEFNDVLSISDGYVPALTGLGESHLLLARLMLSEGRDLTCLDHVNEAIQFLTKALVIRGRLSCIWKLLGDCLTIVHPLDDSMAKLVVSDVLLSNENEPTNAAVTLTKSEALKLGGKFYCQALRLHNNASLWQDFGLNYFYQAQANEEEGRELAGKSIQMLQKGLSLDECNHVIWNCLGVVAGSKYIQDYALAQHSFIKSVHHEPNNVQAWSNLGCLYLERGNIELAHKAYNVAQSLEPSFPNCWIGQSFIAESIGSEEAMDLFRHSTELGLHGQAGVGYGTWVGNVIAECRDRNESKYKENVHDLNAVTASITQLSKYCARHSTSEWALSLYGFLLEEAGLNRSAEVAYKQSLDVLLSRLNDSSDADVTLKIARAKSDYARILCKNKNYSNAVDVYKAITPLQKYKDIFGVAVALVGAGRLEESHSYLLQAREVAAANRQRVIACVAMATLAWKRKNSTEAKEILTSCDDEDGMVLQSLCALGILNKDVKLAHSVAEKLLSFDDKARVLSEATYHNCLLVTAAFEMSDLKKAIRCVQRYIRRFPSEWRFRRLLSQLHHSATPLNHDIDLAFVCSAQAEANYDVDARMLTTEAEVFGRPAAQSLSLQQELLSNHAAVVLGAGKHRVKNRGRSMDSLKVAQRFVHRHPYCAESWSLLAASCHANAVLGRLNGVVDGSGKQCQRASSHVAMVTKSHDRLNAWSIKQNTMSLLMEKNTHRQISNLLSQISTSPEDAAAISAASECAQHSDNNHAVNDRLLADLENISKFKSSSLPRTLISHIYTSLGKYKEAFALLNEALKRSTERNERLKIALAISSLVVEATSKQPTKHDEWCALGRDGTAKSGKYGWDSPITQLMQGLLFVKSKNLKKARVSFNKAFNSTKRANSVCLSKTIAAWNLYKIYVEKNDDQEMEKLLKQWEEMKDPYMEKVKLLHPYS